MTNTLTTSLIQLGLGVLKYSGNHAYNKCKRIIFLSSFNAACVEAGILEAKTLHTLNTSLSLAEDPRTLNVGIHIAPSIWQVKELLPSRISKIKKDGYLSLSEAELFSERILKKTPEWLRYDPEVMKADLIDLLTDNVVYLT